MNDTSVNRMTKSVTELSAMELAEMHSKAQRAVIERQRALLGSALEYIRTGRQKIDPYALTLGIEDALGLEPGSAPEPSAGESAALDL